jgi:hypothetical protein
VKSRITLLGVVGLLIAATCDEPARGGRYTYHITDGWDLQLSAAHSKLVSDYGQGLNTAETSLSLGYRF